MRHPAVVRTLLAHGGRARSLAAAGPVPPPPLSGSLAARPDPRGVPLAGPAPPPPPAP